MDLPRDEEENREQIVQKNIAKWQDVENPLAPLSEKQMDIIYQIEDTVKYMYYKQEDAEKVTTVSDDAIHTQNDFIKWMVKVEKRMTHDSGSDSFLHDDKLHKQSEECQELFNLTEDVINALYELEIKYRQVTTKTDSMHILSEELMRHQKELKDKKKSIHEKLHYFNLYAILYDNINVQNLNVNTKEFCGMLDDIDKALLYLNNHQNFKEAYSYRIKYENLLVTALQTVSKSVHQVINVATSQVVNLDNKSLLNLEVKADANIDSAFSFYYGKFQNAANKISIITNHIEEKIEENDMYKRTLIDCQKAYFSQRAPIMAAAVLKALVDLKNKHKTDHSILFRSAGLFVIKICHDEAACFHYFFSISSPQLDEYLGTLCQSLYDILRPSLISINHLEVLTELCTILKQILNDQIQNNTALDQFVETIKQLIQDVEERLVFRVNVFFQHDLLKYDPSPGDLAYPEKLEQMENIAEEISDRRSDSRASVVSIDLQDAVNLNTSYLGQFRSYTGNSPADLHGMWYPTVKRTLVCLSRLYFCLDREIFQGLAQEALIICTATISSAAEKISVKKSILDGKLFQIKHLLIIREQIAPFQVDFTVKEVALDFSTIRTAAAGLLQKRDKLFSFSSNNALLEFLLEGTPKVKEYLIDSRKEMDKELKASCEVFISNATNILIGHVTQWIQKAEHILNLINNAPNTKSLLLKEQEFARPQHLANIIIQTSRNIKSKIPDIQKSMKLYLANKETEFILFRPIKNNILNSFIQLEQILVTGNYSQEEQLMIACPSTEQLNILVCSVSLTTEQERPSTSRASHSRQSDVTNQ